MCYNVSMYDLIILGGGPAGTAAAVYAARKQLKTAIITSEFGGQSIVSELIYNWVGTPEISGADLASNMKKHVLYYKGQYLDVIEGEKISSVTKTENIYHHDCGKKELDTKKKSSCRHRIIDYPGFFYELCQSAKKMCRY